MSPYRLCLLLALGAVLAASADAAAAAQRDVDVRDEFSMVMDGLQSLSRARRELGFVGQVLGNFFKGKAKVLEFLNNSFDVPVRTIINWLINIANEYNGNHQTGWLG